MRYKLGRWFSRVGDWLMYPREPECQFIVSTGELCGYYYADEGMHSNPDECDYCKEHPEKREQHHRFVRPKHWWEFWK